MNRRRHKRLRIDGAVSIAVQVFPVMPFLGPAAQARLVNLSAGGMALIFDDAAAAGQLSRGARLRVHFNLPGAPLSDCEGLVTHAVRNGARGGLRVGLRFLRTSPTFEERIRRMIFDNEICDSRIAERAQPRCDAACSFHTLCQKPIRDPELFASPQQVEVALQRLKR
ncbi:MAG: PilZ domain-containing protein [Elusimicrobia bacterium]|nr:PilZ domain-containing protein [Elusimicrobiota bacterium]